MKRYVAALICFVWISAGCTGTEGGNPEPVSRFCESNMFGFVEREFTVPSNAPGIPLQLSERAGFESTLVEAQLIVTRNGVVESDWALSSESGDPISTNEIITTVAQVVFAEPLLEGDEIQIVRHVVCDDLGTGYTVPDSTLDIVVGPAATVPTSAGSLELRSSSVVLSLSPDAVAWLHFIHDNALLIGGERLDSQGGFTNRDDRELLWTLQDGSCVECGATMASERDAPQICFEHIWPLGEHEMTASLKIFGLPDAIETTIEAVSFTAPMCAN